MPKSDKGSKTGAKATSYFVAAGLVTPLFIATLYLPQAVYVPNVVVKLLTLSVAPILVVGGLFLSKRWGKMSFPRNLAISFAAFLSYLLIHALLEGTLWQGFVGTSDRNLGILTYLVFFLFAWIGFHLTQSINPRTLLHFFTLLAVCESSIVSYQYFMNEKSTGVSGTFYNPNPVSFFLGISAAGLFAFLIYEKKRNTAEFFALALSQLWLLFGLSVCGSQQGLMVFILIAVVLVFSKLIKALRVNFAKILFPSFLSALVTFFTAVTVLQIKDNSQVGLNPFLERLEIYKSALKLFLHYPLFGVGIDSFHEKYGQVTLTIAMELVDNAHSVPLQILSTLGFIGLALWLTVIFFIFKSGKSGANEEGAEFKFFQVGFFSYLLTGLVGIEHPVIGAFSWFMAGVLIKLSCTQGVGKRVEKPNLDPMKWEKRSVLAGSTALISISLYLLLPQVVVGNTLTNFSERKLTNTEFDLVIAQNLNRIWNPELLLTSGEAYIAIDQQVNALVVANVMLKKYSNDQRTSILLFAIAKKWDDDKARKLAEEVRDRIFK